MMDDVESEFTPEAQSEFAEWLNSAAPLNGLRGELMRHCEGLLQVATIGLSTGSDDVSWSIYRDWTGAFVMCDQMRSMETLHETITDACRAVVESAANIDPPDVTVIDVGAGEVEARGLAKAFVAFFDSSEKVEALLSKLGPSAEPSLH